MVPRWGSTGGDTLEVVDGKWVGYRWLGDAMVRTEFGLGIGQIRVG